MNLSIDDLVEYIQTSNLQDDRKLWVLKNIQALRNKYKDKYGEDINLE